jgi:hypothetical protein
MFLVVRRHNHEEDVAHSGDTHSQPQQCWLLLLQLAAPPGSASCGLPSAAASLQSLRDRTGHVWAAGGTGSAIRAAAAMVIGKWLHGCSWSRRASCLRWPVRLLVIAANLAMP